MNASTTPSLHTLHGLPVLTPAAAALAGYKSVTIDISSTTEKQILVGVCQRRNPQRCCLAHHGDNVYQLCILREDARVSEPETE